MNARPKSIMTEAVRPNLPRLALEALARYSEAGLVKPEDIMWQEIVALNIRKQRETS